MKRLFFVIAFGLFIFTVSGCCNSHETIVILDVVTEEFPIDIAYDMVLALEKPISELPPIGSSISRSYIDDLNKSHEIFRVGETIMNGYFNMQKLFGSENELEIIDNYYYPTLYDEIIEITKSYIKTTKYGNNTQDIVLYIVQEYIGENNEYMDFERTYHFVPSADKSWHLDIISGTKIIPSRLSQS